jgi:hypothetical protein
VRGKGMVKALCSKNTNLRSRSGTPAQGDRSARQGVCPRRTSKITDPLEALTSDPAQLELCRRGKGSGVKALQLIRRGAFPPDVLKVIFEAFDHVWTEVSTDVSIRARRGRNGTAEPRNHRAQSCGPSAR